MFLSFRFSLFILVQLYIFLEFFLNSSFPFTFLSIFFPILSIYFKFSCFPFYIYISSRLILLYFQPSFNFLPPCTFLAIARISSYSVFSISFSSAIFPILSLSFSITLLSLSLYFLSDDPPPPGRVLFDHIRRRRKPSSIRGLILLAASACLAITRTRRIDFHTPLSNCIVGRAVIAARIAF